MIFGSFSSIGTATGGDTPWPQQRGIEFIVSARREPSPLQICLDEIRVLMLNPLAPLAILVAEIRDRLRCVRPVLFDLPRSTWPSMVLRRARPRDVHHGDHLLNFCRMPA